MVNKTLCHLNCQYNLFVLKQVAWSWTCDLENWMIEVLCFILSPFCWYTEISHLIWYFFILHYIYGSLFWNDHNSDSLIRNNFSAIVVWTPQWNLIELDHIWSWIQRRREKNHWNDICLWKNVIWIYKNVIWKCMGQ